MTLVAIEGPECSGKDFLQEALAEKLRESGRAVSCFRTPGSDTNPLRAGLRQELLHGKSRDAFGKAVLMAADVELFCTEELIPALKSGDICLINRYWYSSRIYDEAECARDWHLSEKVYERHHLADPDILVVRCPPMHVIWDRFMAKKRDNMEEGYGYHSLRWVRDRYSVIEDDIYQDLTNLVTVPEPELCEKDIDVLADTIASFQSNWRWLK